MGGIAPRQHCCTIAGIAILEPEDLIETRISIHDDNQFEVKLDYAIDPNVTRCRYEVETYFFVPRSLGIAPYNYTREQFYSDVQAYIRFKTPEVSFRELVNSDNDQSPLVRIAQLATPNGADRREALSREIRLFGCLVRTNMRDATAFILGKMEALADKVERRSVLADDLRAEIASHLAEVDAVTTQFRGLRADFIGANSPGWQRELFEYCDEFVSLAVERHLTLLIATLVRLETLRPALAEQDAALKACVVQEQQHRRNAGYSAVIRHDGTNDSFVHRQSALKKFMSSVLFLDIRREAEGRGIAHIFAGVAAGVAMLFSTIAAIWSQEVYGLNSFPFVMALVVSYVFKDRIKEWLRTYFSAKLGTWLYDYNLTIKDPIKGIVVGHCREAFAYLGDDEIPEQVLRLRHHDARGVLEPESKQEVVMKYTKEVTLQGRRIANFHGRLHDINDIIRFNVSNLLVRMDDPTREIRVYDDALGQLRTVTCPKAYHLNVVLRWRAAGGTYTLERFRVILNKNGIRRLQEIAS